ncbi:GtrA family protein [Amycolatopsis regifaucium]|uniref:Sugar translocase n=1 Tax=Amycolatopsis regifaucium TaxID=546365 RepID=A0A154MHP8_9PSEU|nr:GtrA family protein [Amycolatopsis regifaucium]KZB83896.1 sugar translocase [Amycolatopsis regifaucium]OKA06660.1 sugar translocase [Amycolatopsis regifaucium]SFH23124.1 Putative flippase GtrA (transmembrane translocase of bactoprenol-linked glucose) [Amycolatopsis regifaucium]
MKPINGTQVRFGVVGILNTAIDALGYALLATLGVPIFVANFISTTAGMLLSFTLNRNFTFRAKDGDIRRQAILFFAVTAFGLWVVHAAVIFAVTKLFPGINVFIPKLGAIAVGMVWNYVLYKKVVFRQGTPEPTAVVQPRSPG